MEVEVAVVGGGVVGAAAAWALARRGRAVALFEAHEAGHSLGASHGTTRNFNPAYSSPHHLRLLRRALPLWRELEAESGEVLLEQTGLVERGPRADAAALAAEAPMFGFDVERIPAAEAERRWPGLRFAGSATFLPQGGRLFADRAVRALHDGAVAHGAAVHHTSPVRSILPRGDDLVELRTDAHAIRARRVVVAAGAWTDPLLRGLVRLPRLTVTEEHPAHFALRLGDDGAGWPSFNHAPEPSGFRWPGPVYGLVSPGEGVKVGWHRVGPVVTPQTRTFTPSTELSESLRRYVREWMPGADPDVFEPISCTYTSTDDGDFVLDRTGPIVVAAGFSGHGFKFAPAIGEHLASLASGTAPTIAGFRLER
ncbi:hypothetical protein LK09_15700 [Microbacterium mangrovi]|uniref:FAD dependent oxidoreductase domain-containing protein n=1 Tax=Microbacterium mangrovi TaxID=1348253 RepID=A0A0B2A4A8_9MICO|nr:hypothetical protein LK09_15700 [Microbacterium mangrovi]